MKVCFKASSALHGGERLNLYFSYFVGPEEVTFEYDESKIKLHPGCQTFQIPLKKYRGHDLGVRSVRMSIHYYHM